MVGDVDTTGLARTGRDAPGRPRSAAASAPLLRIARRGASILDDQGGAQEARMETPMTEEPRGGGMGGTIVSLAVVVLLGLVLWRVVDWSIVRSLDFSVLWRYRYALLSGLGMTFLIASISAIVGLSMGIVLAVVSQTRIAPVRWTIVAYVEVWRNTPLLVQVIWIHFALPLVTGHSTTALQSGLLAISLQASAYFTEIVRAGIEGIPRGQWDAAYALGLSSWTRWTRVILPPAIRTMVPALTNLAISFFKATAILSVIQVNELMTVTARLSNHSFKQIELITFAAAAYLLFGNILNFGAALLERRFARADG
ncbi:His/Glu/Gln/Arg/opine family amino acid ABC transporter permease subunit [Chelatococcus asaccharovorans]|uniref:His/Glu/Gln/Arg/opine family amino acid ABC transporter permease subunit n=2 Tax=Chelatococcus asaccharovorans TaxID=28210 RepID=A0A2V3UH08_9HYPH|nr:His/Glu/Gln/Arg/opine family amino acid ABC transporter permease subunit [Chelatococcus asaccharovorans]